MKQGDKQWHKLRDKCAITASECANVVGLGYRSPKRYMLEKLGQAEKAPQNDMMRFGQVFESHVVELYRAHVGDVRIATDAFRNFKADERLGGSVDRLVHFPNKTVVLECKTRHTGELRTRIPEVHLLQMHLLLQLYDLQEAHYACWTPGVGVTFATVTFDAQLWQLLYRDAYKPFADMFDKQQVPGNYSSEQRLYWAETIAQHSHVHKLDGRTV